MRTLCKSLGILGLIAVALLPAAVTAQAEEIEPVKLRVAGAWPPPGVMLGSHAAQLWMDDVTRRTDGKITFQAFWGGALGGKPAEHATAVERGLADVVVTYRWYTPGKFPLGNFVYVFPFGPVDPVIVTAAKRQVFNEFPAFAEELAKFNAALILSAPGTAYQILSKEPVRTLDDFKGKKISLIGRYFGRWVDPTGAVPVVAPAGNRYTMLQTGVVDMDFLTVDLFSAFKIQEQAKNLILVDAFTGCFIDVLINKKLFDSFPRDVQDILINAGLDVEMRVAKGEVPRWSDKVMKQFEEGGVSIYKFPLAERAKWASMVEDIPAEWAAEVSEKGMPGWEIVQRYQEITTELGYEWPKKWGVKK